MIGALDGVIGELLGQAGHGALVLGGDQQARGVLVQAVDDAGPRLAADADQLVAAMGDQGIDQRAVGIARRRMHHQPGRLVDDDEVLVLINHGQRDILALRTRRHRRGHGDRIGLARFDPVVGVFYRLAIAGAHGLRPAIAGYGPGTDRQAYRPENGPDDVPHGCRPPSLGEVTRRERI